MHRLRAIDFFCGTGGFSRGAHQAGFDVVAAFDIDPILTSSYERNFGIAPTLGDIATLTGDRVREIAGPDIDLIFGGPPCQGFSSIGRRRKGDPRRTLLQHFFRLVSEIRPAAFVMENVQGLAFADAKPELDDALAQLPPGVYEMIGPIVLDASDFGAATKRKRLFVIGYDPTRCVPFGIEGIEAAKRPAATVADALSGLDRIVEQSPAGKFDSWRMTRNQPLSNYAASLASKDRTFTGNMRTSHKASIVERFAAVPQGGMDKIGRHPRLSNGGQCPTLRAGTGSDVGSYQSVRPIHPTENRVITVREAARLQGFPDCHAFHPTIWHSFRMIGNSVSPIISNAILQILANKIASEIGLSEAA